MTNWQIYPASVFSDYSVQWDALNRQLYQCHPMLDSRFIKALLGHFGNPRTILAVYPASANQKNNLLLLQPKKRGIWAAFLPSQMQIAPILCTHPQALQGLFSSLSGFPIAIDLLCQDPLYTFPVNKLMKAGIIAHNTTININLIGTFDEYWQQRSKKLQQNVKRYFNRVHANAMSYHVKVSTDYDELKNALQRYGDLETQSWKGKAGTAINANNEQGWFYGDLIAAFASSGQAEIIELYLNEQLVASRINVFNKNILITLKTTYDESLSHYAPGRLLLYLLIEREFSLKRVQQIEFYTNATVDQISWSTGQRNIEHLTIYRSTKVQWTLKSIRSIRDKCFSLRCAKHAQETK